MMLQIAHSLFFVPLFFAAPVQSGDVNFTEALVVSRGEAARRTPFWMDAVNAMIVRGTWKTPAAGDSLGGAAKKGAWEAAKAGNDGWFDAPSLQNGYALFVYESPVDEVRLLDASGHSLAYVNGELRSGDWYQTGWIRRPVAVHKGKNEFLLLSQRGRVRAKLLKTGGAASLDLADCTLPDLVSGEKYDSWCSVIVHNQLDAPQGGLKIKFTEKGGRSGEVAVPDLLPLASRKVAFQIHGAAPASPGELELELELSDATGRRLAEPSNIKLSIKPANATRKVTFLSAIDGSVQYYAICPPSTRDPKQAPGLVLSLHGASVEAIGQASSYAAKANVYIVSPTNRRPYGFDWEDWGRLDALEVLNLTIKDLGVDPRRVWLTGHSMGGHGTWQLGALFPDRFAAIAPSAGWVSFFSYAGLRMPGGPAGIEDLFKRAATPSDTLAFLENYKHEGIYILHGDADDNVPVTEARAMREALAKFHPDFAYHEQPGAGHWWGNACVDWAPIFDMFGRREIPESKSLTNIQFVTPSPGVSPKFHWATLEQQQKSLAPSKIQASVNLQNRIINITTGNLARFSIDLVTIESGKPLQVEIDGTRVQSIEWPATGRLSFARKGDAWEVAAPVSPREKNPSRMGPFKDAFRNEFLFVYGTRGDAAANAWARQKARFDAEIFQYAGNGAITVLSDVEFNKKAADDRNIILYGNADTNSAWPNVIDSGELIIKNGMLKIGSRAMEGDSHGVVCVVPRKGSDRASVAVIGGTGATGMSITNRLSYFMSGVAYPDFVAFGPDSGKPDEFTIIGAGFFGNDWSVAAGEFAWRTEK